MHTERIGLMTSFSSRKLLPTLALSMAAMVGGWAVVPSAAVAQTEERALDNGGKADVTPQQRYNSAIREAGGGLKVALAECRQQVAVADRKACEATAQQRYKADMAQAKEMQRNPDARPVDVRGEPIRSTETTTVIRP